MNNKKVIKKLSTPVGNYNDLIIRVDYTLGGMNYFSGEINKRGYKVFLTPANVSEGLIETTLLGGQDESGYYVFLEEVSRFNKNRLAYWEEKIYPLADQMAELYSQRNHAKIINLIDNNK